MTNTSIKRGWICDNKSFLIHKYLFTKKLVLINERIFCVHNKLIKHNKLNLLKVCTISQNLLKICVKKKKLIILLHEHLLLCINFE